MDHNEMRVLWLVLSFVAFLAIVAWALWPGRKKQFEQDAREILDQAKAPTDKEGNSGRKP